MDQRKKALWDLRQFVSDSRWVIGKLAAETGMEFQAIASAVGVPVETVMSAVQVHNAFFDVRESYQNLFWDHFYVARSWDDFAECLQWADENRATAMEMKAWRRAQHGANLQDQ